MAGGSSRDCGEFVVSRVQPYSRTAVQYWVKLRKLVMVARVPHDRVLLVQLISPILPPHVVPDRQWPWKCAQCQAVWSHVGGHFCCLGRL